MHIKIITAIIAIIVLCTTIFVPSYADAKEENAVKEELLALAKESELFVEFVTEGYISIYGRRELYGDERVLYDFCLEKGYVDPSIKERNAKDDWLTVYDEYWEGNRNYLPFPEQFDSLESFRKAESEYFAADYLHLFDEEYTGYSHFTGPQILIVDGRAYSTDCGWVRREYTLNWNKVYFKSITDISADLRVQVINTWDEEPCGYASFEFVNTEEGWRVSGGTALTTVLHTYPPAAGEHTVFYSALACVSAAVLVTFVSVKRKRTNRSC